MSRVILRNDRREHRLPAAEARLLAQINRGFSVNWWDHYHALDAKRQN
jgi:hypothetical protein